MSDPWMKFYPADWRSDPCLRRCSFAARGLWVDLLCLMHEASPRGYLFVGNSAPTPRELAMMLGSTLKTVNLLLAELAAHNVYSVDRGIIYSRRMVKDEEKRLLDRENGKKGGNPKLVEGVNPPDKAKKPEARVQKLDKKDSPPTPSPVAAPSGASAPTRTKNKPRIPLPDDFASTPGLRERALAESLPADEFDEALKEYCQFWWADGRSKNNWAYDWSRRCAELVKKMKGRRQPQPTRDDMWS